MAKAACFVMAGVEPERHADMAWISEYEFRDALQKLPASATGPRKPASIADQLAKVDAVYQTYGAAIQQIIHGDRHSVIVSQAIDLNMGVLSASHVAVQLMQDDAASNGVDPDLAKTINIAGRQRMLSQLMAKSFCFVVLDIDSQAQRAALTKAIQEFDTALAGLRNGSPEQGLVAPPNREVRAQLNRVAEIWEELRPVIQRAGAGAAISQEDAAVVAALNDPLLIEMNAAVVAYLPSE